MHNANSEGTTPRECSTKHEVRERNTQSADSTVSSFVDSSAQHRGMRPNLIAMKNKILKAKFKPGSSYLARVLKLVNQ